MSRRNSYQIKRDILVLGVTGALKTRLVYGANLNFAIIKRYLTDLITDGHMEKVGPQYYTTGDGQAFIRNMGALES